MQSRDAARAHAVVALAARGADEPHVELELLLLAVLLAAALPCKAGRAPPAVAGDGRCAHAERDAKEGKAHVAREAAPGGSTGGARRARARRLAMAAHPMSAGDEAAPSGSMGSIGGSSVCAPFSLTLTRRVCRVERKK
eukprot:2733217-Prymnesium_polylepis.1